MEFADAQFELAAPMEGGTVLEHLQVIEQKTGKTPQALLDAPACPEECESLWAIFRELSDCRGAGLGAQRITYGDIDAFQRVTGLRLARWEIEAIRRADLAFLNSPLAKGAS